MQEPRPLEDIYDRSTLAALDRAARPRPDRRRSAPLSVELALVNALMAGVAAPLALRRDDEPVIEVDDDRRAGRPPAVSVYLVPGAPSASVAVVRPWLAET